MIKSRRAFIVGVKGTKLKNNEINFLKKFKPWGVILFSRNLKEINQIKKLNSDIRSVFKDSKYPILVDQEGGRVNRLSDLIEASIFSAKYFGNLFSKSKFKFFLVLIISILAMILLIDTFKMQISIVFPEIIKILNNLYESLTDIYLFFKDLIK